MDPSAPDYSPAISSWSRSSLTCLRGFSAGGGKVGWEFPVPLAAGALAIALTGNGAWSLDRLLGLAYPDWLLPAWLVLMAAGAVLALGVRSMQAPKAAQS